MDKEKKIRAIKTFEDWGTEINGFIDFERPNGDIDRFKCKGLTGEEIDIIEKECSPPRPPEVPKIGPDNKPVLVGGRSMTEKNYQDPYYLEQKQKCENKKVVMLLEKGLVEPDGSTMPGKNYEEKFENLNKRLRGDIYKLINFINVKLSNLHSEDVSFFG